MRNIKTYHVRRDNYFGEAELIEATPQQAIVLGKLCLFIIDPMRSSSFFHWCPWIRAYKLTRAVRRKTTVVLGLWAGAGYKKAQAHEYQCEIISYNIKQHTHINQQHILSIYLSIYLSICLSISLSLSLSIYIYI